MKFVSLIKTYLAAAFLLLTLSVSAQHQATWVSGSNSTYIPPAYGTKGVASPTNNPGSRHRTTTWLDANGKFWLFGGSNNDYLNDLWVYDPSTNQWTWISGDNTLNNFAAYGTQGTSSPTNKPGGRYGGLSWRDNSGNLYLFGGYGYASTGVPQFLNDFWKYSITTNEWTWISGDITINNTGVYGTLGVSSPSNKPGSRYGSAVWTDASGNFWMFGGKGYGEFLAGDLSDLWKYNPTTNEWTWINGVNTVDNPGVYGTKGTASPTNKPGSRNLSSYWIDAAGNFWMFGGEGYASATKGNLNDLWKYDPSSNQWTWVSGDNMINAPGVYGTMGVPDANNKPGGRQGMNGWIDEKGIFWIFGGYRSSVANFYNDLWAFDPNINEWIWVSGSNGIDQSGTYGTKGLPSPANIPGARFVTASWTDNTGNHWIYGGIGYSSSSIGYLDDLWKIKGCIISGFIVPATASICPGGTQLLTANGGISFQWSFNGVVIPGAISSTYSAGKAGTYSVVISNGECTSPARNTSVISEINLIDPEADFEFADICVKQEVKITNTTNANGNDLKYSWDFGDNGSSVEENPAHTYQQSGQFNIKLIATSNECPATADTIVKVIDIKQPAQGVRYPNKLIAKNTSQMLEARDIGIRYEWMPSESLNNPAIRTPVVQTFKNIEYKIKITDAFNCTSVDTLLVLLSGKTEVSVPNAFTPDGNGKNDVLKLAIINVATLQFSIFNRSGQIVFQSSDPNKGWDGTFRGQMQPVGTYVWLIRGTDYGGNAINMKGTVILLR